MTVNAAFFSSLAEDSQEAVALLSTVEASSAPRRSKTHGLARALLTQMVCCIWDTAPGSFRIGAEPSGRPHLVETGHQTMPFVSIAHTRGWVACAATEIGPIGIDIERHRLDRNHQGISTAAFGPNEHARWLNSGAPSFYRIWTLREAIAKADGQGLGLVADGRDRVDEGPEEGHWSAVLDGTSWSLCHTFMEAGLSLAIAVMARNAGAVELKQWSHRSS
jgi:phosphopantetheinyl transferase